MRLQHSQTGRRSARRVWLAAELVVLGASSLSVSTTLASNADLTSVQVAAEILRVQDQADATSSPNELQRAFDEQLIAIGVRPALNAIHPCVASELGQPLRRRSSVSPSIHVAAVATHHVPWRIAHDRVEPGDCEFVSAGVTEHLGKAQWPVQETASC